jgi:hypothetical protein
MPIPVPTGTDEKNLDLGECIRFLRKEGYTDPEQREAICFSVWRKAHGKEKKK